MEKRTLNNANFNGCHDSKCFNWDDILSQNLTDAIKLSVLSPPGYEHMFFMSSYLMDIVI